MLVISSHLLFIHGVIMKTILVTGGAGYLGSITTKELVKQGYNVVVLDSLEAGSKSAVDPKAVLEVCNLADKEAIDAVFKNHPIDAVIDFAAYLAVGESMKDPKKYLRNNVDNFINLLDVMRENNCNYIIKSSTAATYGNPTKENDIPWQEKFIEEFKPEESALLEGDWDGEKVIAEGFFDKIVESYQSKYQNRSELTLSDEEKTKLRIPMSIYGLTKLIDEVVLRKYDKVCGIKSIALRYFNVCGADPEGILGDAKPNPTNLMTLTIWQALGKKPYIEIFGKDYETPDGTGIRDYIHPSDLAIGHIKALEYLIDKNQSDVFNLGTGQGSSVLEVIDAVEKASGNKIATKNSPRRSGDPAISVANSEKAQNMLNWKAKYNLADIAETAWKWHSAHPDGYQSNG